MNKEIYDLNKGNKQIKEYFELTDEMFDKYNTCSTEFIKTYYNKTMDPTFWSLYKFLDYLLPDLQTYWQFGVDKAGVSDFTGFCYDLDIDLQNIQTDRHYFILINTKKTLLFYVTNPNYKSGYFHYFNTVGESDEIIKTFMAYQKYNKAGDDMCWGGPW